MDSSTPSTDHWTDKDDLKLRRALEDGGGKVSWSEIAKQAFPDGKHGKTACTEVCSLSTCSRRRRPAALSLRTANPHPPPSPPQLMSSTQWHGDGRTLLTSGLTTVSAVQRWKALSKPKSLRGPWTKEEDSKLETLVAAHGSEKWVSQCPRVVVPFPPFSFAGQRVQRCTELVVSLVQVVIAQEMGSRSGKQCRERWHNHLDPSS